MAYSLVVNCLSVTKLNIKCSFSDSILQREDEWRKRYSTIGEKCKKALKREENIDNRLTNIETSIKTDKQTDNTSSSKIEITPFQHVQLTFKSFFQKSFMLDPRVIILNTFLVFFVVCRCQYEYEAFPPARHKAEVRNHAQLLWKI